jgi:hypothetical protein
MSSATGRLIRIFRIALVAALGLSAAWPDISGADGGSAREAPPEVRGFRGMPFLPPVGAPVASLGLAGQSLAAAAASPQTAGGRAEAVAFRQVSLLPPFPARMPYTEVAPQPPAAPLQQTAPHPTHARKQPSPQTPASAGDPEPAAAPDIPPSTLTQPVPEPGKKQPATYVVTAYYLNVRAEPDKTSPIRGLLERGDLVAVVGESENGWLELENGLYIHGAYAEPAESGPAKNAGREVSVASASPNPAHAFYTPDPAERSGVLAPLNRMVKSSSGMTEEDIAKLLEGTALEGHGLEEAILAIEEEYGINALFTIAVMKLESGNGKSKLAREKNNLFGLNATGGSNSKAYSFDTKSDSVYKFGSLISKSYIAKGYSTIEKVGKKYCPANPKWASLVESIMKRDHRKLSKSAVV